MQRTCSFVQAKPKHEKGIFITRQQQVFQASNTDDVTAKTFTEGEAKARIRRRLPAMI